MQTALRLEVTVLPGHRLEVSAPELPEGARVEIIIVLPERLACDGERAQSRAAALDQFLVLARSSSFHSADLYPTRDELHERP